MASLAPAPWLLRQYHAAVEAVALEILEVLTGLHPDVLLAFKGSRAKPAAEQVIQKRLAEILRATTSSSPAVRVCVFLHEIPLRSVEAN